MATNGSTYNFIASQTTGGSVSSVTFNNIPQNYTDLIVQITGTLVSSGRIDVQFGTAALDISSNYSTTELVANGSAVNSYRYSATATLQGMFDSFATGTGQISGEVHVMNYSSNNMYKTVLIKSSSAANGIGISSGLWKSYSTVNILSLIPTSNFSAGVTITVFGIKAAEVPAVITPTKAIGGDLIVTDGTYTYHAFKSSGAFVPATSLTADILVVAGGGGTNGISGGAGAGGLVGFSSQSLSAGTSYTDRKSVV